MAGVPICKRKPHEAHHRSDTVHTLRLIAYEKPEHVLSDYFNYDANATVREIHK